MAMPPRSSKSRGGSQRWLIIPVALTLVVLLVDASMHARSTQPQATLNSQAWVDKVLPEIGQSSAQGREIALISSAAEADGPQAVDDELSKIASSAASTYKAVVAEAAPAEVSSAAGLLQACLAAREEGAGEMASAVQQLLGGDGPSAAVAQMMSAVSDFKVGDRAYQLFAKDLPKLGVVMPTSVWSTSTAAYEPKQLGAFASRLSAGVVKSAQHKLRIDAITTNPPALRMQGNLQVLSPANTVSVTAVVADLGQSPENGVEVTATITPADGGASQHVTALVDLSEGQADAVLLAGLQLAPSTPTHLTVGAVTPGGEPGSAYKSVTIEVPGPGYTGSAGTAAGGTTTTTAKASSSSTSATT